MKSGATGSEHLTGSLRKRPGIRKRGEADRECTSRQRHAAGGWHAASEGGVGAADEPALKRRTPRSLEADELHGATLHIDNHR